MDEPTRRQLLGSAVALLGLGAGCQSLLDDGSTVAPQYGTPTETTDLLAARQLLVGEAPTDRPLISNGDRTIYVDPENGDDSAVGTEDAPLRTVQTAVRRVPIYLRHQYVIDLATVPETPVRYDEDLLVPTVIGTGQAGQEADAPRAGPIKNLLIRGAEGDPGAVELGSVTFANAVGTSAVQLLFTTLTRDSPYGDEGYGITAYGTGEVHLYDVAFTDGPTSGVLAYGSKMKASVVDLGRRNLDTGIHAKRHGSIMATGVVGELTGSAFRSTQNAKIAIRPENDVTGSPQYRARVGGLIYNEADDAWAGLARGGATAARTAPADLAAGDIWYEDGSGDAEEGFYGQTADGPVRLG